MASKTEKPAPTKAEQTNVKSNDERPPEAPGVNARVSEKLVESNDELELKRRGYLLGKTLGEGSYAKVKAAYDQNRKQKCALKIVNRRKAPKEFQNKFLPRELAVLKKVKHENIVLLYEIIVFGDKIVMVMELAGHGDLLEYIKLRGALDERRARRLFSQTASAIEYLHERYIVHRDLKCENVLLDRHNNVKVSDFGFCKELVRGGAPSCTFCGSSAYASPEILQGKPYCALASDIWSLGVILYIMACGKMPFDDSSIKRLIKDQLAKKVSFPKPPLPTLSNQLMSLIRWMLQPLVPNRATIGDVKHSFWLVLGQMEANKEATQSQNAAAVTASGAADNPAVAGVVIDPVVHASPAATTPMSATLASLTPAPHSSSNPPVAGSLGEERQRPPSHRERTSLAQGKTQTAEEGGKSGKHYGSSPSSKATSSRPSTSTRTATKSAVEGGDKKGMSEGTPYSWSSTSGSRILRNLSRKRDEKSSNK